MKTNANSPESTCEINNFHPSTANWLLAFLGVLGLILASLALSSCTAYTTHAASGAHEADSVAPGTEILTPSSTAVDFGNVGVGSPSTQTVSVTNTGTATVSISQPTVSGAAFTLAAGTSVTSLAAGQATSLQIEYDPTSMGASTGTLTFVSSATNSPVAIALSGTGTEREIAASPAALNFNSLSVGQNGTQNVTLTNSGNATVTINQVSTTGAGYSTSGISAGQTIAASASLAFTATFTPSAAGAVPGSVTITTNAVNSTISIPLSGTGTQGSLAANPGSVSFGNVVVGNNSSQQVTIKNSGNATVTISQVSTTGGGYSASGISAGQTIAANASLAFTTTFTPSGAGAVPRQCNHHDECSESHDSNSAGRNRNAGFARRKSRQHQLWERRNGEQQFATNNDSKQRHRAGYAHCRERDRYGYECYRDLVPVNSDGRGKRRRKRYLHAFVHGSCQRGNNARRKRFHSGAYGRPLGYWLGCDFPARDKPEHPELQYGYGGKFSAH